jgi:hypothetical protein
MEINIYFDFDLEVVRRKVIRPPISTSREKSGCESRDYKGVYRLSNKLKTKDLRQICTSTDLRVHCALYSTDIPVG